MLRFARDDAQSIAKVASCLGGDVVAVLPADTMYGLSTRLGSATGHDRILRLKGYESHRPLLYLASNLLMVERYIASWGCASRGEMAAIWPAPLTAILPAAPGAEWVGPTIAFRVPGDAWIRQVVDAIDEPLASTSVNTAGTAPLVELEAIVAWVGDRVDLLVTAEIVTAQLPSTVVDFTGDKPVLVRAGGYPWATRGNPSN